MCQHRKSEVLYFLSVINSGVNLPQGSSDVELCNCRGSLRWPLSASPGTDNSYGSFCCSMDFWESTFLSEASAHLMGLGLSTARPPGIYVSLGLDLKSIIWGSVYNSGSLAENYVTWENCLQFWFSTLWKSFRVCKAPRKRLLEGKCIWFCNSPGILSGKGKDPLPKMGEE